MRQCGTEKRSSEESANGSTTAHVAMATLAVDGRGGSGERQQDGAGRVCKRSRRSRYQAGSVQCALCSGQWAVGRRGLGFEGLRWRMNRGTAAGERSCQWWRRTSGHGQSSLDTATATPIIAAMTSFHLRLEFTILATPEPRANDR